MIPPNTIQKNSEKRKIFIALGVVVGIAVLVIGFYFLANAIVVDECGGNYCKKDPNWDRDFCPYTVCEPLTLWESIFGE